MANTSSARKATRKIARKTEINKSRRTMLRNSVRKVEEAIASGDRAAAMTAIKDAEPAIMRAAQRGVVHKNTASRKVSRLVHRIASRNAFIGCAHPDRDHIGQFLVCSDCGSAAELDDRRIDRAIRSGAEAAGFAVERPVIELAGRCPNCRDGGRVARR